MKERVAEGRAYSKHRARAFGSFAGIEAWTALDSAIAKLKPFMRKEPKYWDTFGKDARAVAETAAARAKTTKMEAKVCMKLRELSALAENKKLDIEASQDAKQYFSELLAKITKKVASMPAVDPSLLCQPLLWEEFNRVSVGTVPVEASANAKVPAVSAVSAPAKRSAEVPSVAAASVASSQKKARRRG